MSTEQKPTETIPYRGKRKRTCVIHGKPANLLRPARFGPPSICCEDFGMSERACFTETDDEPSIQEAMLAWMKENFTKEESPTATPEQIAAGKERERQHWRRIYANTALQGLMISQPDTDDGMAAYVHDAFLYADAMLKQEAR